MASINIPLPSGVQQGLGLVNNLTAQLQPPQSVYDTPAAQTQAPDVTELAQLPSPPDFMQSTDVDLDEALPPRQPDPVAPGPAPFGAGQDVYVAPMSTRWQRFMHKMLCIGCCQPRR